MGEVKNNNQLATGASKVGGCWRESVDDHRTTRRAKTNNVSVWWMLRAATKRARAARAMAMRVVGN